MGYCLGYGVPRRQAARPPPPIPGVPDAREENPVTHLLYRAAIPVTAVLGIAAAVAGGFGAFRWSAVCAGLALAALAALTHLQSRRLVAATRTMGNRLARGGASTASPRTARQLREVADRLDRAAQRMETAVASAEHTALDEISATAMEFRREMRMARLLLEEDRRADGAVPPAPGTRR